MSGYPIELAVVYNGAGMTPLDCARAEACYQAYGQAHIWRDGSGYLHISPTAPPPLYQVTGALTREPDDPQRPGWFTSIVAELGWYYFRAVENRVLLFHRRITRILRWCSYRMMG